MTGHERGRPTGTDHESSAKRKREEPASKSKSPEEGAQREDASPTALKETAGLLNDPRLSHPANAEQAALLLRGLQQSRGNAHVRRLLSSRAVQAKLTVHPSDDEYEKEADRVAETVTRAPQQQVQRQVEEEEEEAQTKAVSGSALDIQKQAEEEEEEVQAKAAEGSVQRQEVPEREEEIQTKAAPGAVLDIQRQAEEEEEEVQAKPAEGSVQRQEVPEEEETVQTKAASGAALHIQKQAEEEEEEVQAKPTEGSVQRQEVPEEEEEAQMKAATVPTLGPTIGPYYGIRKVNPAMDEYEFNKNLFGAPIFKRFVKDRSLWQPLDRLVESYWRNFGNEMGIALRPEEHSVVWRLLSARCSASEMSTIRQDVADRGESKALIDAFWVEFRKEYPLCYRAIQRDYWRSDFRLDHEFMAAYFGMVKPPYMYWARTKRK